MSEIFNVGGLNFRACCGRQWLMLEIVNRIGNGNSWRWLVLKIFYIGDD